MLIVKNTGLVVLLGKGRQNIWLALNISILESAFLW